MPRTRQLYLIAFDDDAQPVYGKNLDGKFRYAEAMTLKQARAKVRRDSRGRELTVYKLVKVRGRKEDG